jgi:simple sugar transport system ATP-binding protein
LAEVLHATDRITIMRQGRAVERTDTATATAAALARAMVGREVSLRSSAAALGVTDEFADGQTTTASSAEVGKEVLRIEGARLVRDGVPVLDGLDLSVREGEIVGVAGVEGNGQRELGDVLSSLVSLDDGRVIVDGRHVRSGRAGAMARAGIAVIPEDRHDSGCVLDMSIADNLLIDRIDTVARAGFISRSEQRRVADSLMGEFEVLGATSDRPFGSLSGGNQQRVILARELSHRPRVLVAAQPTRGLDVGAIEYMSRRLRAAAESGIAVLLVSTELEEILDLSDRIVVVARGRVIGELARHEATSERLGLLLGGIADHETASGPVDGADRA